MDPFVQYQVGPRHEGFPTVQAFERVLPSMDHLVHFETGVRGELIPAGCADVHLSGVSFLVLKAVRPPNVALPAVGTHETFVFVGAKPHFGNPAEVFPTVGAEVGGLPCADSLFFSAVGAGVEFLGHVGPLVGQEIRTTPEGLAAMPTLVTLLLRVRFVACLKVGTLAEPPCMVFPPGVGEGGFVSRLEKPF